MEWGDRSNAGLEALFSTTVRPDRRAVGFAIAIAEGCFARTAISSGPAKCGAGFGAAAGHAGSCAGTRKFAEPNRTGGGPVESTHPAATDDFAAGVGDRRLAKDHVVVAGAGGAGGARRRVRKSRAGLPPYFAGGYSRRRCG